MSGDTVIQRLNKVICKEYTVEISCDRSKILDVYEEGELEEVYFASDFYQRSSTANPQNLSSNLKEGIENVLKHYTQYNTYEEYMKESFHESFCSLVVYRHINSDCNEPSDEELESWKKGDLDLYAQYTHIKVKVNSVRISPDLIVDLIKGE
tara:strand:+ start:52 stop:507 length:456 start_codon:yes stop_codon:yes gene_type:complete